MFPMTITVRHAVCQAAFRGLLFRPKTAAEKTMEVVNWIAAISSAAISSAKKWQGSDASRLKLHAEAAWPAAAEESFRQGNWTPLRHDLAINSSKNK